MRYKISKSAPLPKTKEHKSKYDELPLETLQPGESILIQKVPHEKGESSKYMKHYSAARNGILISASQKRLKGELQGEFQVGIYKNRKSPLEKEIRVWRAK